MNDKVEKMKKGGEKLRRVKNALKDAVKIGVSAIEIENLANDLIEVEGGKPSFKMVPGYSWATCISVNEGLVHGIPKKEVVFKKGDLVSVDVGMYYLGYHTDSSFTVGLDVDNQKKEFLGAGEMAFNDAVKASLVGNKIFDISEAIQKKIEAKGYSVIRAFVGHTIGKSLHEEPQIPCFVSGSRDESVELKEDMTLAIEVMYAQGEPDVARDQDGWTIFMRDGKISALFEETILVAKEGPIILT